MRMAVQLCPLCSAVFAVAGDEDQARFEAHVDDCADARRPDDASDAGAEEEGEGAECPVCGLLIPVASPSLFHSHVNGHFGYPE